MVRRAKASEQGASGSWPATLNRCRSGSKDAAARSPGLNGGPGLPCVLRLTVVLNDGLPCWSPCRSSHRGGPIRRVAGCGRSQWSRAAVRPRDGVVGCGGRGPDPAAQAADGTAGAGTRTPRVLGVDEFAFRKGYTYGTVLVDVEAGRVVDVLPDRTSQTFAAWLKDHPGAEMSAVTGPPPPPRRSSRPPRTPWTWPTAGTCCRTCLQLWRRPAIRTATACANMPRRRGGTEVPEPPAMLLPLAGLFRTQIIERPRHRDEDIHRLLEKRWTISAIAHCLNLDRKTVRRFRDTDLDELLASARDRRPNGALEPFKAYLNARFT